MRTTQEKQSSKDAIVICLIIGFGGIVVDYFASSVFILFRALIFFWLALSIACGFIGKNRKIGFGGAFFLSLLLSPLIGFILTMVSTKYTDVEFREQMVQLAQKNAKASTSAELQKLSDLKDKGILSEEEFTNLKQRLLDQN